jgi:hypothetical protein
VLLTKSSEDELAVKQIMAAGRFHLREYSKSGDKALITLERDRPSPGTSPAPDRCRDDPEFEKLT